MSQGRRTSFVVRVAQDGGGDISGVVEHVATGAKEAFAGVETIGAVIARMLRAAAVRQSASRTTPAGEEPDRV